MSIKSSPFTATELRTRFGVTRAMVRAVIYNRFFLPADYKPCMKYYKLRTLTGHQFASFLTNEGELRNPDPSSGQLPRFTVIYQDCTPAVVKKAAIVSISFRIPDDSFNIEPVAMVKLGEIVLASYLLSYPIHL